jgi:hypothetical protein
MPRLHPICGVGHRGPITRESTIYEASEKLEYLVQIARIDCRYVIV